MERRPVPFDYSYWVEPGRLLAGCFPGHPDPEVTRSRMEAVARLGIGHVVNLMPAGELGAGGRPFPELAPLLERLGMTSARLPTPDGAVPSPELVRTVLDEIDGSIAAGRPVYVHCRGGAGRTGVVVGCWLVRHGRAEPAGAVEAIRRLQVASGVPFLPSPQNAAQAGLIAAWDG